MRGLTRLCLLVLGLACSLAVFLAAPRARAQPAGLPAVISVEGSELGAEEIQAAIERELGVRLVIDPEAQERLEVAVKGRQAIVTHFAPEREPVTRSVDLPHDRGRALDTIAFLAGNLARDEASELLAQLAPPPATEPESAPPPAPPPAPAPAPAAAPPPQPAPSALIESEHFVGNVSFYHPLTALKHTEQRRLNLELGVAYSWVGAIKGAGMTLGYFRSDGLVKGFSAALGWNRSNEVKGLQLGGLVNEGRGDLHGISLALLVNLRDGDSRGVQGALLVAKTHLVFGVQGSAVAAVAREVQGLQTGLLLTVAGPLRGGQVGFVNVAAPVQGLQVGLVNASGALEGTQIGLVNVARSVHGFELGLVNVAGEIHGGALGLVSIAKNGRLQPTTWLSGPDAKAFVGLKSVTDLTYSLIGVGYGLGTQSFPDGGSGHQVAHQESFGGHLTLAPVAYAEAGIGYAEAYKDTANSPLLRSEVRFDARLGLEPLHGLTLFAGGTLTRRILGGGAPYRGEYFVGLSVL